MATQDDRIEQFNLQGNLCGALHAIVGRLQDGVEPLAPGIMGALCKVGLLLKTMVPYLSHVRDRKERCKCCNWLSWDPLFSSTVLRF